MAKINDLRSVLLAHLRYPLDLFPTDFYLFPNLKRWLQGQRFLSIERVKWGIDDYSGGLDESFYKRDTVIELKGDYVEE